MSVGGAGVDPPSWKMDTFFLGSLALSVPIYGNFHSNGANWQSFKLWTKNLYNALLYKKIFSKFETPLVNSNWLEIFINWHTKSQGPKKKCTCFTRGRRGPTHVLHKPPAIRVVLLHKWRFVQSFSSSTVYNF